MTDIIEIAKAAMMQDEKEKQTPMYAPTMGLGFHQFEGTEKIADVLHQIGADFTVRKDSLVRLPENVISDIINGNPVTIDPKYLIKSHMATVCCENDKTINIVGADYGVIQNTAGFEIMDLVTNSSVSGTPMQVVSAGLVHDFEPYVQVRMGEDARIEGDNSNTEFYAFFHNSHDGGSAMRITFSAIRVICRNTFMANMSAKGLTYKHTKYVQTRVNLKDKEVIKSIQVKCQKLNLMKEKYIERMTAYRLAKVTDKDIDKYIANLFFDKETLELAERYGYNLNAPELELSTRMGNMVTAFKDTLESGIGQDTNRGTKLWLFNGTTNYLNNTKTYATAEKRFDSLMEGTAYRRMEKATELLAV